MPDDLDPIRATLLAMSTDDLDLLQATTIVRPAPSSALQSWVEHAWDWEVMRRRGFDFPLASIDEAVEPDELPAALKGATALFAKYVGDHRSVARFFSTVLAVVIDLKRGQLTH